MTKGLRCPNCDSTIHRKVVLDYILNQTSPYLRCKNPFCNVRWSRSALEANKAQFLGDYQKVTTKASSASKKEEVPKPKKKVAGYRPYRGIKGGTWLDRMRSVARHHAQMHGTVSVDDLRHWADKHSDQPSSPSAWGAVFHGDDWKKVSDKPSTYETCRSRRISVWALKQQRVAV